MPSLRQVSSQSAPQSDAPVSSSAPTQDLSSVPASNSTPPNQKADRSLSFVFPCAVFKVRIKEPRRGRVPRSFERPLPLPDPSKRHSPSLREIVVSSSRMFPSPLPTVLAVSASSLGFDDHHDDHFIFRFDVRPGIRAALATHVSLERR